MRLRIIGRTNRITDYTGHDLFLDVRRLAKGKGRVRTWWVEVNETGNAPRLCVEIARPDGLGDVIREAI